jgi:ureidoacrylate peracid hydrolase
MLDHLELWTSALLVIDMQNAFRREEGTLHIARVDTRPVSCIVPPLKALIRRFRAAGVAVLWTMHEDLAVDVTRARKRLVEHVANPKRGSALAGSCDEEIIDELKVLATVNPSFVIRKHRPSAFYATRLEQLLRMLGTQTIFVAGMIANAGLETTILEASMRDYAVVAITDCISSMREESKRILQALWSQLGCVPADSTDVLRWLEAQQRPRALGYAHMLLQVADIAASTRFYVDLLGFTVRQAKPLPDGRPFVPFNQGIALTSGGSSKLLQIDHIAFRVHDVRALADRLRNANVKILRDLHDGIYGFTIYVADPDGNKIELYEEPGTR